MMQQCKRPLAIGFFFSLGHSTVVVAASIAVAVTTSRYQSHAGDFRLIGDRLAPDGGLRGRVRSAGDHLGTIGLGVVAMFLALWGVAVLINRLKVFGGLNASAAS